MSLRLTTKVYILIQFSSRLQRPQLWLYTQKRACRSRVECLCRSRDDQEGGQFEALLRGEVVRVGGGTLALYQETVESLKGSIEFDF